MVAVIAGALASMVNKLEHGGQVGMVFEMYRSNVGFFKLMQETIKSNISEKDVKGRENGRLKLRKENANREKERITEANVLNPRSVKCYFLNHMLVK
jgi:hypothetical protein